MNDTQPNIIKWTFANWITVVLMAATGFAMLGAVTRFKRVQRERKQMRECVLYLRAPNVYKKAGLKCA